MKDEFTNELTRATSSVDRMRSNVLTLRTALMSVGAAVGVSRIGDSFLDAAKEAENYRTTLVAVMGDQRKAAETFRDINLWAAARPVDTSDAVASYVKLKAAAVANAEEGIRAIGDLATVMHRSMQDVAGALVSTETAPLRDLGILLDRTGENAVIRSGHVRTEVGKDIDSIREGIIEVIERRFGGAMDKAADDWDGAVNTMRGIWTVFRQDLMGSSGDGGPFDYLESRIRGIRDSWTEVISGDEYRSFIDTWKDSLVSALESVDTVLSGVIRTTGWLVDHRGEILGVATAYLTLAKGIQGIASFEAGLAMLPQATSLMGRLGKAFAMFSVTPGWIQGTTAALDQLGISVAGIRAALAGPAGLVALGAALGGIMGTEVVRGFLESCKAARLYREELKDLSEGELEHLIRHYEDQVERIKTSGGGPNGRGFTEEHPQIQALRQKVQGWKEELEILRAAAEAESSVRDREPATVRTPDEPERTGFSDERLVRAKNAGAEVAAAIDRNARKMTMLQEAAEAAALGVARFWEDMAWENRFGFLDDEDYFSMLQKRLRETAEEFGQFSAPWKGVFEDLQSLARKLADEDLERVREQLRGSAEDGEIWNGAIDGLIAEYGQFPALIGHLESLRGETEKLNAETNSLADDMSRWLDDFQDGIADAIVSGKNFSDVLADVGRQLAKIWIKYALFGGEGGGGLLSFLLPKAHAGGVIGSDSFASASVSVPRYHSGGIVGSDEQLAVLRKGEGVFTPGQMKALGEGPGVAINVINNTGVAAQPRQETRFDGRRWVVDVWLDALANNVGGLRTVVQGGR
ncbi:hypothetical protein KAR29_04755 [Aminithiophilus ramosus]|uniref:Bacteriophage tail tape measure C-terminal domain-containing protein n=1 Tax=Aminithiophilus ramosus TaxID=3029084 RepID=A0A9Q7AQ29_9BACT|nr:hypothetical protein [Aminithiophilus ramosus]QTX33208.1 hypothetical protein KAR29_04755 [Aminithiophilus ramosus]